MPVNITRRGPLAITGGSAGGHPSALAALTANDPELQPGFEDDPGQAVYNRVWILGDDKQVSVAAQARLDQITELIPVQANAP